ncbi:MAG: hypothetical protein K5925_05175 [Bacilli bacterium]|nr:hypothetical protein [Bacilli bacterium]
MRLSKKINLFVAGSTALTLLGFVGSIAGTLAWYAYNSAVRLSFTGTAVRSSVQLEVGLVDDDEYFTNEEISTFNLTKQTVDGHKIVWNRAATGFTSDMIRAYLDNTSYAINKLSPVSSLARSGDDDLTLYQAPECSTEDGEYRVKNPAALKNYLVLPFAFRVLDNQERPVKQKEIWITSTETAASGHDIDKALRVFIDDVTNDTRYLFNPSSNEAVAGETSVCGPLDLNGDGFYDYNPSTRKEYVYGEIASGTLTHSDTGYAVDPASAPNDGTVNGTGDTGRTTFCSRHLKDIFTANMNSVIRGVAEYETKRTVFPDYDGNSYSGGMPVTITANSEIAIGYSTLTIFLEGWDHVVIDEAAGYSFNLGLQFEINKV